MSEPGTERLPEFVDEARTVGGTAACECGYSVRFDGDESYDEAREKWHSDEHREQHFDDGLRADGGTERQYGAEVHTRTLTSITVGSGGCFLGGIVAQSGFLIGAFVAALAFAGALWYLPSAETVAIQYRAKVAADERGDRGD